MLKPHKQTWDTRAWLVGIIGGIIGGNLTVWPSNPTIQAWLNTVYHPSVLAKQGADIVSGVAAGLTLLILPGLVSGLARRLTFLWGLLPLGLFLVSVNTEEMVANGIKSVIRDWWVSLAILCGSLIISSGPVSLIRWLRVRAVRRRQAVLASYEAMREAASVPQEGAWPPPPDYRA